MRLEEAPSAPDRWLDYVEARRYGDGLPVVRPTPVRVARMCAAAGVDPDAPVPGLAPADVPTTAGVVAANAVMAGCRPEAFGLVLAAHQAMSHPDLNLYSVQTTTHPVAVMCVVNGPVRRRLRMPLGSGAVGPGFRATATLGRALRFLLMNVGGAVPGGIDRATHGTPAKFSFCFAENEEDSPWLPLSTRRGVAPGRGAVTVAAVDGPYNVSDHGSDTAEGIETSLAEALAMPGTNAILGERGEAVLIVGPEHARLLAARWGDPADLAASICASALIPAGRFAPDHIDRFLGAQNPDLAAGRPTPTVRDPRRLHVVVAGGPGRHTLVCQGFGYSGAVTEPVTEAAP